MFTKGVGRRVSALETLNKTLDDKLGCGGVYSLGEHHCVYTRCLRSGGTRSGKWESSMR